MSLSGIKEKNGRVRGALEGGMEGTRTVASQSFLCGIQLQVSGKMIQQRPKLAIFKK